MLYNIINNSILILTYDISILNSINFVLFIINVNWLRKQYITDLIPIHKSFKIQI